MATTTRTRRRFPTDEKRRLVHAWRASGHSQCRFGRDHGIPQGYLSRWSTELGDAEHANEGVALTPVSIVDEATEIQRSRACVFEVRLPSGVEVAVPGSFDRDALAALLSVLGSTRC